MKRHMYYYFLMSLIFLGGFSLVFFFGMSKQVQMTLIVTVAFLYVLLGVWHHARHHDLHLSIILEYVGVASLGIAVSFFLVLASF